jgi:hypothetical protein
MEGIGFCSPKISVNELRISIHLTNGETLSAGLICQHQHTFVSGPSIQLAFLTFKGTGTLHDPTAMNCFMFLCCLDQISSHARDTWNLFVTAQNHSSK